MAIYEYYCPTCRTRFERRAPMSRATEAVTCTAGHSSERTISQFSVAVADPFGSEDFAGMSEAPMGGGCACGGGACGCQN